ncbi:MAG: NAD(P)H-hydrate dehydratase, partial [Anaerolineae bacterium]|nr:NAD(P)H-hydrate dehydratase [Anaerolineae bacterium]
TPHPGEFGRLAGMETADVQTDRLALARDKSAAWNAIVVLKGAFTVIAAPDGRLAVSPFASAALARAGTGDVLSGMITSLLGQGLEPFDATLCAVWLHGAAGERAADTAGTTASIVASDLLTQLAVAFGIVEHVRP